MRGAAYEKGEHQMDWFNAAVKAQAKRNEEEQADLVTL